jgi:hypothetical protein
MPPRARPPRLARPGRGAAYVILDRGQQHATRTTDPAEAETALAPYITEKHVTRIAHGKRDTDKIPIADGEFSDNSDRSSRSARLCVLRSNVAHVYR